MANDTNNSTQDSQGSSLSQFFTTLLTTAFLAAIQITIFTLFRTKFRRIYEPKTFIGDERRRVKPLPRTLCGWLPALLRMPQEDLIRTSGLDAYFFARYIYVHAIFFLGSFVLLAIILFPIYVIDGKDESFNKTGLDLLTFGNISPSHSSRYAAPLVLAYCFIGSFFYLLYVEMRTFVEKRQAFLRSVAYQASASAKTILVMAIPKEYMSRDVLLRIFNQFPGGVKYIWLNRNLENLPDKADERLKFVEKLETIECKLIKATLKTEAKRQKKTDSKVHSIMMQEIEVNHEEDVMDKYIPENKRPTMRIGSIPLLSSLCFGKKVDAINHCKEMISQLNTEIEYAKTTLDDYDVLNSAFIQFNKPIAAHMAVQSIVASTPSTMTPRYIDIKPANIIWPNLKLTHYEHKLRELIMLTATISLIVFWSIPVAFVGFLSNLTYLTNKLTFLRFIYKLPTAIIGLITGLLPSVLLAILMALLPIVLRLLAKMSGVPTTDAIEHYVQGSYFVFQVVHVFLVVTISSSVASVVTQIIETPTSASKILAANIPTASNFFLSFLALRGLNLSASLLLQIVTLILFPLLGKLFDNTPRKKWKRHFTLTILNWGTIFPIFTNFVVITVVYSIIAPLILLISGLALVLCYIAYTYRMFYVSDYPNDIGGLSFPRAIYQSFTGIYLMELMLAGLFFLAQNDSGSQSAIAEGILMCVLIAITIGVHFMIRSSFNPLIYHLPVDAEEYVQLEIPISGKYPWSKSTISGDTVENIQDTADESYENMMKNAYMHPALRDPKPIVWIPQDELGIAIDEVQRTQASELNIRMSTKGTRFNEKFNIKIDGPPPDHEEIAQREIMSTSF